ncbi:MAG: tetratricopeptide repeat protein, partial [bacterium]
MADHEILDAAIRTYQDKLRQNPTSLVFVQLADAYRKKGSMEEALAICREGLERNPNLLSGLIMLGRVHAANKQPADAVEVLKRVIQREPNNLTAHALLSQSYMQLNHFGEAISEYQKILTLNPEDTAAQQALQVALDRMRKEGTGNARPALASAERKAPAAASAAGARVQPPPARSEPPPAMEVPAYAAAVELAERGLYEEAIEAFQRILEADPENYMARQKLREVYAMREATDAPALTAAPPTPGAGESQANKISDDEILYLLGLMEAAAPGHPSAAAAPEPAPAAAVPMARPVAPAIPAAA